jgi:hypothetical protein
MDITVDGYHRRRTHSGWTSQKTDTQRMDITADGHIADGHTADGHTMEGHSGETHSGWMVGEYFRGTTTFLVLFRT